MTGEARDAVSAYTQVMVVDVSRLSNVPERVDVQRIGSFSNRKDNLTIVGFPCERNCTVTHWKAFLGNENPKRYQSRSDGGKYHFENALHAQKTTSVPVDPRGRYKVISPNYCKYQKHIVQKYGSGFPHVKDPKKSDQMDDPLVHLKKNLFGHPLAGLFWPTKLQDGLFKNGLEKVTT